MSMHHTQEHILELIAETYEPETFLDILKMDMYDLTWQFRDEIFETIRDSGEFGTDELVNSTLRAYGLCEGEEESDEE